ncbi:putative wall-associated receptor kinase, galacturonan-binding domain-containing protein [Helianthus anomalus]
MIPFPYPFGIRANCSVNKWYVIDCNSSKPYLSALDNMEVLSVSLEEQTITVNASVISRFQSITSKHRPW